MRNTVSFLVVLACLYACRAYRAATGGPTPGAENAVNNTRGASVVSVILKVKGTGMDPSFELTQVALAGGSYKRSLRHEQGWFKACFTDKNGVTIDSSYFENPAASRVEYLEDDGKLATGTRNSGGALIRTKYDPGIAYLVIYNELNKKINTFDIQAHIK